MVRRFLVFAICWVFCSFISAIGVAVYAETKVMEFEAYQVVTSLAFGFLIALSVAALAVKYGPDLLSWEDRDPDRQSEELWAKNFKES